MKQVVAALSILALCLLTPALSADTPDRPPSRDLDSSDRAGDRYALSMIRAGHATGRPWPEIARLSWDNPARFAEIVLPPEGPRVLREEMPADYVRAIEAEAARDEAYALGEARLWREGWLRIARDVVPQLDSKDAPGARRIALEFLKLENAGDGLGFDWREEPDTPGNRAARARWKALLEAPRFAASGTFRHVVADVVRMRAAPSPSAPVTARLRINTWVRVARTDGEYVEVVVRAGGSPARGFVERRFVAEQSRLDVDPVLETARKEAAAGRPLEALTWAERAFALDRSSEAALDLLEKTARDAGQPERAEPARRLRTGQVPITFGVCARAGMDTDFFQLVVVANLSPKGELSPVSPGDGARLASEAWFVVRPSVPGARGEPFYGTPTVRPRRLSYMYGEGTLLSLGEACKPGEVWATVPLREVRRSGLNAAALEGKLETFLKEGFSDDVRGSVVLDAVEAPTLLDGAPAESVLVRGRVRRARTDSEPGTYPVSQWALFGAGGRMLQRVGDVSFGATDVGEVLWTAPAFGPAWRLGFVLTDSSAGTTANGDVLVVLVDPEGNVKTLPVHLWDGGC